jgi:hypothetical protein
MDFTQLFGGATLLAAVLALFVYLRSFSAAADTSDSFGGSSNSSSSSEGGGKKKGSSKSAKGGAKRRKQAGKANEDNDAPSATPASSGTTAATADDATAAAGAATSAAEKKAARKAKAKAAFEAKEAKAKAKADLKLKLKPKTKPEPPKPPQQQHDDDNDEGWEAAPTRSEKDARRAARPKVSRFTHMEASRATGGERVNVLEGLALHHEIIGADMEAELIGWTDRMVKLGQCGGLRGATFMQSTFTDAVTGARGQGRQVLQFGSFYDYASHEIAPALAVEPLGEVLEGLIDVLLAAGALPLSVRPDTAIINIYRVGDNIPPHIDHTDYPRPFSTLSLLSDAPMLFGTSMEPLGNGSFGAPFSAVLPRRSLLVLKGNGADMAKHCIPSVKARRISITLRKQPPWARDINNAARANLK